MFSGALSSATTLDLGGVDRQIDGISFVSEEDWIVGDQTGRNQVVLTSGDTANVFPLEVGALNHSWRASEAGLGPAGQGSWMSARPSRHSSRMEA